MLYSQAILQRACEWLFPSCFGCKRTIPLWKLLYWAPECYYSSTRFYASAARMAKNQNNFRNSNWTTPKAMMKILLLLLQLWQNIVVCVCWKIHFYYYLVLLVTQHQLPFRIDANFSVKKKLDPYFDTAPNRCFTPTSSGWISTFGGLGLQGGH